MLSNDVRQIALTAGPETAQRGDEGPAEDRFVLESQDPSHAAPHLSSGVGDELGQLLKLL